MQKVWSISGRSIAVSALALALTACQSMRGPEPVAQADIPTGYIGSTTGPSVAEQGYKDFFADQRLVQVIELALANNRDLRTATLNINVLSKRIKLAKTTNCQPLVQVVVCFAKIHSAANL